MIRSTCSLLVVLFLAAAAPTATPAESDSCCVMLDKEVARLICSGAMSA